MTNLAKETYFTEEPLIASETTAKVHPFKRREDRVEKPSKKARVLSGEDRAIIESLEAVKQELACLHNRYDQITDPMLLESVIYELKAANIKYIYFLQLCKEKGIVNGIG